MIAPGPSDPAPYIFKTGSMVWTRTLMLLYLQFVQNQARLMEGTRNYLVNSLTFALRFDNFNSSNVIQIASEWRSWDVWQLSQFDGKKI